MSLAIETHNLTKAFEKQRGWLRLAKRKSITAVNDVSLTVKEGELFGLLGPNGAGKTTLVKMLSTLILPSSGAATIAGYGLDDPGRIRAEIGLVVTDERSFYWRLSARQNLNFYAALHNLYGQQAKERVDQVLAAVNLTGRAEDRFSDYSSGMKQRLAIARSLIHHPSILFMDEPSRSLDPTATQQLHDLIHTLMRQQGVTIFLITHDLAEAEKLCHRVAVMHQGRIQAIGQPEQLRQQLAPQIHYTLRLDTEPQLASLKTLAPDLTSQTIANYTQLTFAAGENDGKLATILHHLQQANHTIHSIEGTPPSLEEVFTHFTQSNHQPPATSH